MAQQATQIDEALTEDRVSPKIEKFQKWKVYCLLAGENLMSELIPVLYGIFIFILEKITNTTDN